MRSKGLTIIPWMLTMPAEIFMLHTFHIILNALEASLPMHAPKEIVNSER